VAGARGYGRAFLGSSAAARSRSAQLDTGVAAAIMHHSDANCAAGMRSPVIAGANERHEAVWRTVTALRYASHRPWK
jgi:hypothetical protein